MKRNFVWMLTLLAATLTMAACGGGGSGSAAGSGPAYTASMGGNWSLKATSTQVNAYVIGALTQSGQSLSGVFHVGNSPCYNVLNDVPVTGTVSGSTAKLTSASVDNQVLTATLTAGADASSATGTYTITGGCGGGDSGQLSGNLIPSFSGTWKGSFQSTSGQVVSASANITQTGPDVHGWYSLQGTVTFQGSPCFTAGTISNGVAGGNGAALGIITNDTPAGEVYFQGSTDPKGATLTGQYQITSGACIGDSGTGTLTRQ